MHGSEAPSVRGCPNCRMFVHHHEGCKHMICYGCSHTRMRHQSIAAADDIEVTVRSRKDVTKDWKEAEGPSLAMEKEGTDLRNNPVVERSDAAVWKRGPVSDRQSPPDSDADTSGWQRVTACDGDLMAACRSGLRMSGRSGSDAPALLRRWKTLI